MLTNWLRLLHADCNFKVRYRTLDKEYYRQEQEARNISILPTKPVEFYVKNVSLGEIEQELKSMYVEVVIDNAGYKQPHEYILSGIYHAQNKYILTFIQEYVNWPACRIVEFNEYNNIIRNDFKRVYDLSWKDFREGEYQVKKRPTLT